MKWEGRRTWTCGLAAVLLGGTLAQGVEFQLLAWPDAVATESLPSAAARKPGLDWLSLTGDDDTSATAAAGNTSGAFSHNFVDLSGGGGNAYQMAPSLTGTLSLDVTPSANGSANVAVTGLRYGGLAMPNVSMNQFLVASGSSVAQTPQYNVDGLGNQGAWAGQNGWHIQYILDYYFAASMDGDPSEADIDATFNDVPYHGYLLPIEALATFAPQDDPAGFHSGDFGDYLRNQIAPRLPADATYLLVVQAEKSGPVYTETGLPITLASKVGNTTIAYTIDMVPEPSAIMLVAVSALSLRRWRRASSR